MRGGLEIVIPVGSPFLEKVAREQRIGRDHPRKPRDNKSERGKDAAAGAAEAPEETGEAMSSTHIDLRI